MNCPICSGDLHPASAARYAGCCSDLCWEVQDARQERDLLRKAIETHREAEMEVDRPIRLHDYVLWGTIDPQPEG